MPGAKFSVAPSLRKHEQKLFKQSVKRVHCQRARNTITGKAAVPGNASRIPNILLGAQQYLSATAISANNVVANAKSVSAVSQRTISNHTLNFLSCVTTFPTV